MGVSIWDRMDGTGNGDGMENYSTHLSEDLRSQVKVDLVYFKWLIRLALPPSLF